MPPNKPEFHFRIFSGGQSGVDRAALDAARETGFQHGGWCPKGRLAEDGIIPPEYNLTETPSGDYDQRTEWNVRDSDATLILTQGAPAGGTAYTIEIADKLRKPLFVADVDDKKAAGAIWKWLAKHNVSVLNVAGPRESTSHGIYEKAKSILIRLLRNHIKRQEA